MITKYINKSLLLGSAVFFLASCSPDTVDGDGNGLSQGAVDGSFKVAKTAENRYRLTTNANNYITTKWNIDDEGFNIGKNIQDIFLPDAGTYVIEHQAYGMGGVLAGTGTQTITVPTSDPIAGNMILGGRFDTPDEVAKWTTHKISASGAQWVFANGKATIVASGGAQQGIFQAVNVVAGQKYSIDMVASSDTALVDTWFEVYVLNSIPVTGQDISGTVYRNINTWSGCGKSAFKGKVSSVGCDTVKNAGIYTATTTGTVYLEIKCGGSTVNSLSIDKVEFRRMQ
ncbi:hypothetical protein GCM10022217_14820 [Chryseobacterium ginsenosidimutans]|uniref:hypothetical protein n=1 Tax=Chryseobacterium ginsenosidimutans TaxID=687846 RepID=UPI0031CDD88F